MTGTHDAYAGPLVNERTTDAENVNRFTSGPALVGTVAALTFALHLALANVYGLFIDELYFLACGQHLAWGYVDMPPLTALQAFLTRALFGDSLYSIRLFPALAAAGIVLLTGAIARELGGRRLAQVFAAVAVALAPLNLFAGSYLSMNSIEPLVWMGCVLVVLRIMRTGNVKLWLAFGALAGLGLLNKHTVIFFGFALVVGLLLTPARRLLWNRWFVLGGVIAFVMFLPNLVWMVQHRFPHLELLANIRSDRRNVAVNPIQFMAAQAIFFNPVAAPVWLAGLWHFLAARAGRAFRAFGWTYLIALGVLLATDGRVYYLAPIYPMLFAAGAVAIECWTDGPRRRWVAPAYAGAIVVTGVVIAPTFLPVLPPETYVRYTQALHINQPRLEHRRASALPQLFADRFGWPEMVAAVAKAYFALPPEERAKTAIFANDYGQAGAIDFYGPKYGLPKAISGHLTYWMWGPRDYSGEQMLVLGDTREGASRWYERVEEVGQVGHVYAMAQEHFPLLLVRKPKGWMFPQAWPQLKRYN